MPVAMEVALSHNIRQAYPDSDINEAGKLYVARMSSPDHLAYTRTLSRTYTQSIHTNTHTTTRTLMHTPTHNYIHTPNIHISTHQRTHLHAHTDQ